MSQILRLLQSRLPGKQAVLPVFSTLLFFITSWAVYRALWWLPSWLEYLSLWNVSIVLAYTLSYALIESALMTGVFLLVCGLLPGRWFKEQFLAQGAALAGVLSAGAVLLQRRIGVIFDLDLTGLLAAPALVLTASLGLIFVTAALFRRWPRLRSLVEGLAGRMTTFAYIYVPLGIIGLAVALLRNLL